MIALLPTAALAQPSSSGAQYKLRDLDCKGVTVAGSRMPARAVLRLTLVNKDNGKVMARRTVRATANGRFSARFQASTRGVRSVRAVIASSKGRRLGWVEHTQPRGMAICRLPFTGPFRPSLALLSAGLLATGAVVVHRTRGANAYWPSPARG